MVPAVPVEDISCLKLGVMDLELNPSEIKVVFSLHSVPGTCKMTGGKWPFYGLLSCIQKQFSSTIETTFLCMSMPLRGPRTHREQLGSLNVRVPLANIFTRVLLECGGYFSVSLLLCARNSDSHKNSITEQVSPRAISSKFLFPLVAA